MNQPGNHARPKQKEFEMNDLMKLLLAPVIAGTLILSGCGSETTPTETDQHSDDDGHDHANEVKDSHDSDHDLGEIEVAGVVLKVSLGGEPKPNATLHLDLEHQGGPTPVAIRVWIGNETATGSIKGRASGSGGDYHADAVCPAELKQDDALWVEVESADGTRAAVPLPIS